MAKICDNTSVGQIIRSGKKFVVIERANYPEAYALPAGHVDGDPSFTEAMIREIREEAGLSVEENQSVFKEDLDNPCKRMGGTHHLWEVYEAVRWSGTLKAGSDAKRARWFSPEDLKRVANRTEYFMEKYKIPYDQMGKLTVAIFGKNPEDKATDPEWKEEMGLEPVWYYILKKVAVI
ncbi:MAG: NUDIX hydrolase [bacterium]|nr:NUDIX hydrolase [bacterium]